MSQNDIDQWAAAATQSLLQTQAEQIRSSVGNALTTNPDQEAQTRRFATAARVPLTTARALPDVVKQQAQMSTFDAGLLARKFPTTAQLVADPDLARITHDDIPTTTGVEQAVRVLPAAPAADPLQLPATQSSILQDAIHYIFSTPGQGDTLVGDAGKIVEGGARALAGTGKYLGLAASTLNRPIDAVLGTNLQQGALGMANSLDQYSQGGPGKGASFKDQLLNVVGSTAGVLGEAALTGGASVEPRVGASVMDALGPHIAHGVQAMMVPSAVSAQDTYTSVLGQTGDAAAATKAALASYVTSSLGGVVPFATPGKLAYRMASGAAMGPLLGDVSHQAMNLALPANMQQPERTGEDRALDAVMGIMFGGMAGPHDVADIHQRINDAARQSYVDAIKNEADVQGIQALHNLGQVSAVSKLRERDPAAFKAFVEQVTEDGHLKEVYVDPEVLSNALNQSGVTAADLQATMPDVLAQIKEAQTTQADVRIPVSDYTTHLAGTPIEDAILQHLKTSADGKTYAEAQTFYQNQVESLKGSVDKMLADKDVNDAAQVSRGAIRDQVLQQLNEVNRFRPDVNRLHAEVIADHRVTMAERMGMTPEQFAQTYPLQFTSDMTTGRALDQAARVHPALLDMVNRILESETPVQDKVAVGEVHPALVELAKSAGLDIAGFTHAVDTSAIRHIWKNHSDEKTEVARGNVAVTREDIASIPEVFGAPDRVVLGLKNKIGRDLVGYLKRMPDGSTLYFEEVRTGKKELAAQSLRKYPATTPETSIEEDLRHIRSKPASQGTVSIVDGPKEGNSIEKGSLTSEDRTDPAHKAGGFPSEGGTSKQNVAPKANGVNLPGFDQTARGQIAFGDDITKQPTVISLLKDADLSTTVHELGHFFLEIHNHLAQQIEARIASGADVSAGERAIAADMATALDWMGVKAEDGKTATQRWASMSLEEKREAHEKFARGFETYLMEGKAPSVGLAKAFQTFRSWLLNVYKSLTALHAELTPEVRSVFDRMLASDEAIKDAESVRGYRSLFEVKPEGMTDAEFADYQALGQQSTDDAIATMQARSIRDMQWLSNAKSKALRDLQRDAAGKRREVQDQVTKEVMAEPVYQAQAFLNRPGNTDPALAEADKAWRAQCDEQHAANLAEVRRNTWEDSDNAKAGEKGIKKGQFLAKNKRAMDNEAERRTLEWEKSNPRPQRAKAEYPPDIIAEMFGFTSGKEMQDAIKTAGSAKDAIAALTDQRMLEQHGDLVGPQSIERAAEAAIHNEARARFVATELKALSKATGPARQLALGAQEAANAAIAAKIVGDIRPAQYTAAEGRAGRAAKKALLAGDIPAAAAEKRTQLLNNRLAKAAADALDEVPKGLKFLRKFDKPAVAKAVGAEYMDRINELVSQFDITRRFDTKQSVQAREQFRDWLQSEANRTGVMPEVSDRLLDWTKQRHWKELSVAEFRGLVDAVKSLEHVGREQTLVTVNGQKVALEDMVARAQADLTSLPHSDPVDVQPHLQHARGLDKIAAQWLNAKSKVRGMDAALIKMEQLFQWLTYGKKAGLGETRSGPFLEMFQRAGDAEGVERSMRADSSKELRTLGASLRDAKVDLNEALTLPLTRKGRGNQWYREELIAAALNTGNEGNLSKMLEGYGWNERQLMDTLDTHLSATEWKFVQGVWDAVGKYGPQIEALQKRLTGVAPEMVKPRTVHTSNGDFAGGYYPVVYDAFLDHNIESKQAKNTDMLFENQWARPTTSKGHTVNRTGYVGPIQLSLGVIPRHIDQVTHDLAWREAVIDINKFLSHDDIRAEVDQTMGREYTRQFRPWLQALANDKVFNTAGDSAWESLYRKARTNATIVGLGFRVSTMEIHGLSALSNSVGEVGTKWFAKGAAQFATPERWEASKQFMFERSAEMANRFNESDRNIREAIDEINAHQQALGTIGAAQKVVDGARKFAFYGVSALDMASAAPTWMGAYLKGIETAARGGLDMSEADAVDFANRAVRNAHGGGGVKDLSAVQRDKGAMSMATMFYSFWNHMYNRQRDLVKGYGNLPDSFAQGTGTRDFAKLLARSWWYFVVPQLIHAALKPSPTKDQGEDLSTHLMHFAEEIGLGFVSGVPVLRDLANAAVNGRDYTITPLEQAGKSIVHATVDTYKAATGQETSKHAGKNAVQAVGYVAGLPTGQLSSTGAFLWDVLHGEQSPQDLHDWWQGVTSGRSAH